MEMLTSTEKLEPDSILNTKPSLLDGKKKMPLDTVEVLPCPYSSDLINVCFFYYIYLLLLLHYYNIITYQYI